MATFSVAKSKHSTLTANQADTVTITAPEYDRVEIFNRHATSYLFATVDGIAATVAGDNTLVVPPNSGVSVPDLSITKASVVSLISDAAVPYSVTGFSGR